MEGKLTDLLDVILSPAKPSEKHFWRCPACLEVWCMEYRPANLPAGFRCPVCDHGGHLDYMGAHEWGETLVKEEMRCACNGACQGARGPDCSCKCHGENHGVSRWILFDNAVGSVPKLPAGINRARAMARRDEFLNLYREVRAELDRQRGPLLERKRRREYIPAADFHRLVGLNKAAAVLENKVNDCKVHGLRMKKLDAMAAELGLQKAPAVPKVERIAPAPGGHCECTGHRPAAGGWLF